jgi:hypothetical protein
VDDVFAGSGFPSCTFNVELTCHFKTSLRICDVG